MDNTFSPELKELISKSREIAIDLGYDYISTIHFFLADCESESKNSILNFGFKDKTEYLNFKKNYTLEKVDLLNFINGSLPLTKEAETTIRLTETERMLNKQNECYPFHLFIAALKNKESLFFECFQKDDLILDKLTKYYQELGEFEKGKMTDDQISKLYYVPIKKNKIGIISFFAKLFKQKE